MCVCVCTCACVSFITRLTQVSHTEIERFAKLEQKPKLFLNFYFQNRDNTFFFFFKLPELGLFFFFFLVFTPIVVQPSTHLNVMARSHRVSLSAYMYMCEHAWVCERVSVWAHATVGVICDTASSDIAQHLISSRGSSIICASEILAFRTAWTWLTVVSTPRCLWWTAVPGFHHRCPLNQDKHGNGTRGTDWSRTYSWCWCVWLCLAYLWRVYSSTASTTGLTITTPLRL